MLFRELEGREVIDRTGQRVGFVHDIMFTNTGKVTHLLVTPAGIINKLSLGQLNVQFEDIDAIEDVIMLRRTAAQVHGREPVEARPAPKEEPATPAKPVRILLKKKGQ